jgi:hypothetical protein
MGNSNVLVLTPDGKINAELSEMVVLDGLNNLLCFQFLCLYYDT